jgi:TetR/AcrR family transcriptional regulator
MSVPEQIIDHATKLLAEQGYEGTSLQEIADAVGLRKPSLLHHFPSKEEVRRGVLGRILARWQETVPRLLRATNSGEGQFEALFEETVRFFSEDSDRARLLLREILDRPQETGALIAEHLEPWLALLTGYIRQGQKKGTIQRDLDPATYVLEVVGLILTTISAEQAVRKLAPLLGDVPAQVQPRLLRELKRIARTSLFHRPARSSRA